jgi:hypothetical protein
MLLHDILLLLRDARRISQISLQSQNNDKTVCAAGRGKTNFFEKRVGEYQKASIMSSLNGSGDHHIFRLDEDF